MSHKLVPMSIALLSVSAVAYGSIVHGYAYKEGESDHSGIKVEVLTMVIPPVPRYTDSSGHFDPWLAIPGGLPCRSHTFKYSASGFETQYLDYCIPPLASVLLPDVTLPCPPPGPCDYLNWNEYPYCPEGSNMCFPDDEGQHFSYVEHPAEWWYANFHLTGESGREYGAFVAFFKLPRARLFGISDLEQGIMYTDVRLPPFSTIYDHWLDLTYCHTGIGLSPGVVLEEWSSESTEAAAGSQIDAGSLGVTSGEEFASESEPAALQAALLAPLCDRWYNRSSGGDLLPYEYRLHVRGWDGSPMRLDVDMVSLKAPMLVGGEGLVDIGDGQSYYYCHSRIDVAGTIRVHGLQEQVTGQAWIDHQWGDFLPQDQDVSWEWFSIQLDDGREIMVADLWLDGELQGSYSGGLNLYNEDCSLELLEDYTITPLDTWADPDSDRTFATQWEIEEPTRDIHLIVTAEFDNQVMRLTPGFVFTPTFWEGSCWVSGTIDGQAVSGRCYAELTHSIEASPYGEQYDGQTRDP